MKYCLPEFEKRWRREIFRRKHRVALLGPFPPAVGGIATNLQNLLSSALKEKYDFYCIQTTSRKCGSEEYQNEKIYSKILRIIVDIFKYPFFLISAQPDLIHINTSFGTGAFWRDSVYMVISRLLGKRILFQIHGGNIDDFLKRYGNIRSAIIKNIFRLPTITGVLSLKQRKPFIDLGINQRVQIFPNMLDSGLFSKNDNNIRLEFNLPDNKYMILFIAPHLFIEKGVYEFLSAASIILKKRNDVYFVIVGCGGEEIQMKSYCKKHDFQSYVRFMGNLSHNQVIKIMRNADLFTLPSYSEGFPMVILEAMAAGLPVISTDVGAIPEIIKDGENGFILKPKDYNSLAEKIDFFLKRPEQRKAMGERNKLKVEQKYDSKIVSEQFDKSYQQLLF